MKLKLPNIYFLIIAIVINVHDLALQVAEELDGSLEAGLVEVEP